MITDSILPKEFRVKDKYSIKFFIKKGSYAETYRVKGKDGKLYFLKLFNLAKIHHTSFDSDSNLLEIELLNKIKHENIISYRDSGELIYGDKKYFFLILDFISGETLEEKLIREPITTIYDLRQIITGILKGLNYLHNLPDPIIHNEITPNNIMLDLSGEIPIVKIIDFGHARSFHQPTKVFLKTGINLHYMASECFNNLFTPQSDLFSVGAVMYYLIYGIPPWCTDISKFRSERIKAEESVLSAREKPLSFDKLESEIVDLNESILKVVKKALSRNPENRFKNAIDFVQALQGEIEIEEETAVQSSKADEKTERKIIAKPPPGKGFSAVAGMHKLKELLTVDVIDALRNPEKYKKYGISFPNGILFYGPPRCGKTFFAKKFAEEVGYNYVYVKPSDLKSRYVNATQENIAKLFKEAEKNAPSIIFIDEINEIVPNRESDVHEMTKSAVNEMLAQMDRTGDKGIFVIGATNFPDMIDPAILGAGRLEKMFYIGPPDFELRKALFESYLKDKPIDFGINYNKLAELTENYVTGDIELLVNEAAKNAMVNKKRVSMEILEFVLKNQKPTVKLSELKKYEIVRRKMEESVEDEPTKIKPKFGF